MNAIFDVIMRRWSSHWGQETRQHSNSEMKFHRDLVSGKLRSLSELYSHHEEPVTLEEFAGHIDILWYRNNYPDVAHAGLEALEHYVNHGHREGRDPSATFRSKWYAFHNRDVSLSDGNGLVHYITRRCRKVRPSVAFFAYSWNPEFLLDPYIGRMVSTVAALGLNVDVYIGNEFVDHDGVKGMKDPADEERLAEWIKQKSYDFAISFNNSLVLPAVIAALRCRVVSIIVDSKSHLFDYYEIGSDQTFKLEATFIPIYTSLVDELKRRYPDKSTNFIFIPAATEVQHASTTLYEKDQAPISWIASLVGDGRLDNFLAAVGSSPDLEEALRICVAQIERAGSLEDAPSVHEAVSALLEATNWSTDQLEMQLQNIVTNNSRIDVVNNLAPLGLRLYGNDRWRQVMPYNLAVVKTFRSARSLKTHEDLMQIYNNSRISVNWPQAQAGTGLQYRVFDILASKSMLITKDVEGSDLFKIFGKNNSVETYANLSDLVDKCKFYLENETERAARVNAGNKLVSRAYSFEERAKEYLAISNPAVAASCLDRVQSRNGVGSVAIIPSAAVLATPARAS